MVSTNCSLWKENQYSNVVVEKEKECSSDSENDKQVQMLNEQFVFVMYWQNQKGSIKVISQQPSKFAFVQEKKYIILCFLTTNRSSFGDTQRNNFVSLKTHIVTLIIAIQPRSQNIRQNVSNTSTFIDQFFFFYFGTERVCFYDLVVRIGWSICYKNTSLKLRFMLFFFFDK